MSPAELSSIVLPVFAFIAIGAAVGWSRILAPNTNDVLGDFVFTVAVPVLIFRAIGTLALPEFSPWPFWGTYFAAAGINLCLTLVVAEKVFGLAPLTAITAFMSATFSNLVMLGLPLVSRAFGPEGLVTLVLLVAVHVPVMMTVSAILIEVANARAGAGARARPLAAAARVGRALATNPVIVGIAAGFLFRQTGLPLTGMARDIVDRLADTAVPLALISLGMSLYAYGIRGNFAPALGLAALKLVAMPAVVLALTRLGWVGAYPAKILVIAAACPTGINAYLFAVRYRAGAALAASTTTLSTAAALLSLSAWLYVVG